ncbi:uncharacterized protein [Aquarana catesbeiana]|uniref:uncharacterized protein n=1 Tax=Aquarana catesbeiana TaxID=8400 RepID=UPI003CC942C1
MYFTKTKSPAKKCRIFKNKIFDFLRRKDPQSPEEETKQGKYVGQNTQAPTEKPDQRKHDKKVTQKKFWVRLFASLRLTKDEGPKEKDEKKTPTKKAKRGFRERVRAFLKPKKSPTEKAAVVETPEKPVVLESPEKPVVLESPEKPVVLESPEKPVVLESPEKPVVLETPEKPVVLETPEKPVVLKTPEKAVVVEITEKPAVPETLEKPQGSPENERRSFTEHFPKESQQEEFQHQETPDVITGSEKRSSSASDEHTSSDRYYSCESGEEMGGKMNSKAEGGLVSRQASSKQEQGTSGKPAAIDPEPVPLIVVGTSEKPEEFQHQETPDVITGSEKRSSSASDEHTNSDTYHSCESGEEMGGKMNSKSEGGLVSRQASSKQEKGTSEKTAAIDPKPVPLIAGKDEKPGQSCTSLQTGLVAFSAEKFTFYKLLGAGHFGRVLLATDHEKGKHVAVKRLKKRRLLHCKGFIGEHKVLQLTHGCQFLIAGYAAFHNDNYVYYVMELAKGGTLHDLIYQRRRKLSFTVVRFITAELVCAIQFLHRKYIIHRDIKPDNVLFTSDGHVKLTDFGLALKNPDWKKKKYGTAGTPQYTAPEVILGKPYNVSADWFSLGVTVFEMLARKLPFDGGTIAEIHGMIVHRVPPCHVLNLKGSGFVRKLLVKEPKDRASFANGIRRDSFFCNFNWQKLKAGRIRSPVKHRPFIHADLKKKVKLSRYEEKKTPLSSEEQLEFKDIGFVCPDWADHYYVHSTNATQNP